MNQLNSKYGRLTTVITACFNSASSIERCIRSVWAQSLPPLQHIVVDDGSTDSTHEILSELAREIPYLKILRQPNRGAGPARNAAIEAATGRYIAFLDSDDVWLEGKLAKQIKFMEEQRETFTYSDYAVAASVNGRSLAHFVAPPRLSYNQLLVRCPIGCSTVAYNQELLGKQYMPAIRRAQDWALWLALTRRGVEASKYPGCDVIYHRRKGSLSRQKLGKAIDMYRIYTVEEGIGRIFSAYLLTRHAANVVAKKL
jgi:glycosyltransferase involved in cell wall biosynthesis